MLMRSEPFKDIMIARTGDSAKDRSERFAGLLYLVAMDEENLRKARIANKMLLEEAPTEVEYEDIAANLACALNEEAPEGYEFRVRSAEIRDWGFWPLNS